MGELKKFRGWFSEFRIHRMAIKEWMDIDGRALYSYQLSAQEFSSLRALFKLYYRGLTPYNRELNSFYGAAYVLLGSEFYRREYQRDWSWQALENFIGIEKLEQEERLNLIELGFRYWKLPPVEKSGRSRDFLGAVLRQGGLPWRLVQDKNDPLGRLVHTLLKSYAYLMREYSSLKLGVEKYLESYFIPQYQNNTFTFELIEQLVHSIVAMQKRHPELDKVSNPIEYLNANDSEWRYRFPIPIDEENANRLFKSWFIDAQEQLAEEAKERINENNYFLSNFYWIKDFLGVEQLCDGLISEVRPPHILFIPKAQLINSLTSLRVELIFYEGDIPIARGITVYAQSDDLGGIQLDFHRNGLHSINLNRQRLTESLIVKFLSNGIEVYQEEIPHSALNGLDMPLFFIKEESHYKLVSDSSSYTTPHLTGYLYAPGQFELEKVEEVKREKSYEVLSQGEHAQWIKVNDQLTIVNGADRFVFEVDSQSQTKSPYLLGEKDFSFKGRSSRYIYRVFPKLINAPVGAKEYINGTEISETDKSLVQGNINYQVRDRFGNIILMRRFAILPEWLDFKVDAIRINRENLESKIITQRREKGVLENYPFEFLLTNLPKSIQEVPIVHGYQLLFSDPNEIPATIEVGVPSTRHVNPLVIKIPIHLSGVRLQKDEQLIAVPRNFTCALDELLGLDLKIFHEYPISHIDLKFSLQTSYYQNIEKPLEVITTLRPGKEEVTLNLFSMTESFERLFAIVDDLDAKVHLEISAASLSTIRLCVKRHHISGKIVSSDGDLAVILHGVKEADLGRLDLEWFSLVDPSDRVSLTYQRTLDLSEGIHSSTKVFFGDQLKYKSLGLIISKEDSLYNLRPLLYVNYERLGKSSYAHNSIERAVVDYHPYENPEAFFSVFTAMKQDYEHVGWEYFRALKKESPPHLSLSTFAAWKMLARDYELLTKAYFKLSFKEDFCLRIQNELSVIWESIPFETWKKAAREHYCFLVELLGGDFTPELSQTIFILIQKALKAVTNITAIPLNLLEAYIHSSSRYVKNTYEVAEPLLLAKNNLITANIHRIWPTHLNHQLVGWFQTMRERFESLFLELGRYLLSNDEPSYRYSTLILPCFMAAVATEFSDFLDVGESSAQVSPQDYNDEVLSKEELLIRIRFVYQQLKSFDHTWYEVCYECAARLFLNSKERA